MPIRIENSKSQANSFVNQSLENIGLRSKRLSYNSQTLSLTLSVQPSNRSQHELSVDQVKSQEKNQKNQLNGQAGTFSTLSNKESLRISRNVMSSVYTQDIKTIRSKNMANQSDSDSRKYNLIMKKLVQIQGKDILNPRSIGEEQNHSKQIRHKTKNHLLDAFKPKFQTYLPSIIGFQAAEKLKQQNNVYFNHGQNECSI
ncbi:UNKNOWN [Stylonychia lemnae]|uniref:Uncharacterized protein n=1 Tax=Stylonychia lemnae TaxID=5949 RepID=A0A078B1F6_STYLE|nr:UNKNOWN [Stylonychia lemnae]|eukprot:CDW87048.1 UNKNOWN [Stylonychia lemnae]